MPALQWLIPLSKIHGGVGAFIIFMCELLYLKKAKGLLKFVFNLLVNKLYSNPLYGGSAPVKG